MLNSRRAGEYKDVSLEYGGTLIDVGFLVKDERLALAAELLSDVSNLICTDFDSEEEFLDFIKENV